VITVRLFTAASLLCLVLAGCGESGPPPKPEGVKVSGKVLMPNGSPLGGGTLILRPEAGLYGATAQIQSDGTFTLQDAGGESVIPGRYQVFVRFPNPSHDAFKKAVPARYQENSDDIDSDVIADIQGPTEDLVIRLKS